MQRINTDPFFQQFSEGEDIDQILDELNEPWKQVPEEYGHLSPKSRVKRAIDYLAARKIRRIGSRISHRRMCEYLYPYARDRIKRFMRQGLSSERACWMAFSPEGLELEREIAEQKQGNNSKADKRLEQIKKHFPNYERGK